MRIAHEVAASAGGSVMKIIPFELNDDLDKKGRVETLQGRTWPNAERHRHNDVDLFPPMIARDMACRAAMRRPDNMH
jgi:hypothetical protein